MPLVTIIHHFTYHHSDGTLEPIGPGTYDFSDEMAKDQYVLWHSDKRPYCPPKPGTPEYALADRRRQARQKLLDTYAEELEEAKREQENIVKVRQTIVSTPTTQPIKSVTKPPLNIPTVAKPAKALIQ